MWDSLWQTSMSATVGLRKGIYYRVDRNASNLNRVNQLVSAAANIIKPSENFSAHWLLIFTYYHMESSHAEIRNFRNNTFQAILAGDGKVSYVILLYPADSMSWWTTETVAGFSAANYSYRMTSDELCDWPQSNMSYGDEYAMYNCAVLGSNTRVNGLWILSSRLGEKGALQSTCSQILILMLRDSGKHLNKA